MDEYNRHPARTVRLNRNELRPAERCLLRRPRPTERRDAIRWVPPAYGMLPGHCLDLPDLTALCGPDQVARQADFERTRVALAVNERKCWDGEILDRFSVGEEPQYGVVTGELRHSPSLSRKAAPQEG